jgi:hypothetical protein
MHFAYANISLANLRSLYNNKDTVSGKLHNTLQSQWYHEHSTVITIWWNRFQISITDNLIDCFFLLFVKEVLS